jgi:hypothetical protein
MLGFFVSAKGCQLVNWAYYYVYVSMPFIIQIIPGYKGYKIGKIIAQEL